jgi:hypothetical protein
MFPYWKYLKAKLRWFIFEHFTNKSKKNEVISLKAPEETYSHVHVYA